MIKTGNVQIDPSKIAEVVDLYLMASIATSIPADGSIEYIFPPEVTEQPYETVEGCTFVSLLI